MTTPWSEPEFLPFRIDTITRQVLLLRLTAAQRRAAAFLDERALAGKPEGGWMAMDRFVAQMPALPAPARAADAIFHIGHCGSTLLSRLLDSWPDVQGLREPLPLRTLAEGWPRLGEPDSRLSPAHARDWLAALWSAWSRPLAPHGRSIIKATSGCNGLIAPLLEGQPTMRVVLLAMPLQPYLAALLKSPDSVRDAASAAGERLLYLRSRGVAEDLRLHALSLPQQCAMGWLAERIRFGALAAQFPARVLRVDFEDLLAHPQATLQAVAAHLALDPAGVDRALASPAWGRYSKQQEHGYGAADRAHDLTLATRMHANEIAEGVAWVEAFVRRHPQCEAEAEHARVRKER